MTGYKNIKKEVSVIVGLITYEFEAIDNGWDDQLNLQKIKKLIVESKKL